MEKRKITVSMLHGHNVVLTNQTNEDYVCFLELINKNKSAIHITFENGKEIIINRKCVQSLLIEKELTSSNK